MNLILNYFIVALISFQSGFAPIQPITTDSAGVIIKKANVLRANNPDSTLSLLHFTKNRLIASQDYSVIWGNLYFEFASAHYVKGNFDSSQYYIQLADSAYRISANKRGALKTANILGLLHQVQHNEAISLIYFKKAFQIATQLNDSTYLGVIPYNMGISFSETNRLDSALYYYRLSFEFAYQFSIDLQRRRSAMRIAETYNSLNYPDSALSFCTPLMKEMDRFNNWDRGYFLGILAETYFQLNDYKKAALYANQGLGIQEKIDSKWDILRLLKILSKTYHSLQDYESAYTFLNRYTQLNDSLFSSEKQKQILKLELENKLLENDRLAMISLEREKEIQNHRLWTFILISMTTGILFTLLVVTRMNYKNNRLQKELSRTNSKLKENALFKNELMSIIGHDMNNMLAPLTGFFNMIHSKSLSLDEFLTVSPLLESNIEYLQLMFSNLQKWAESQHENYRVQSEPVNIVELANEMKLVFKSRCETSSITFILNLQCESIWFDEEHLRPIFRNLIHNALKFTPNNGNIELFCKPMDNKWFCGVLDSGIGINEELKHQILNDDTRISKPGIRSEKGTGLGLTIVKRFLQLNNSQLRIESETGKSSCFFFEVKPI